MLSLSGPEAALLQERRIADCPDLVVECPDQIASEVKFVAHLNGVSPELVNWEWSVVGGSISRGQGTSAIVVHRLDMSSTTATVEVGGLSAVRAKLHVRSSSNLFRDRGKLTNITTAVLRALFDGQPV